MQKVKMLSGPSERLKRNLTPYDLERFKIFTNQVNQDITVLNKIINNFNKTSNINKKHEFLEEIISFNKIITDKYPPYMVSLSEEFRKNFHQQIHQDIQNEKGTFPPAFFLLNEIRKHNDPEKTLNLLLANRVDPNKFKKNIEYLFGSSGNDNYKEQISRLLLEIKEDGQSESDYKNLLGLRTVVRRAIYEQHLSEKQADRVRLLIQGIDSKLDQLNKYQSIKENLIQNQSDFPEFLETMTADKISKLTELLSVGDLNLTNLYTHKDSDIGNFEFIRGEHSIVFLGGINSQNFKVTNIDNGFEFILKVDKGDGPQNIKTRLMGSALRHTLTPIFAERQATFTRKEHGISHTEARVLLLTEYCPGGDLASHAKKHMTEQNKLKAAANIYTQMAEALEIIRKENAAFPDMKNSNWLIDANEKIRIADTKSFLPAVNGEWNANDPQSQWFSVAYTDYMNPPELKNASMKTFNVGAVHAYQFGKNLYEYLTNCEPESLDGQHDGSHYNFNYPIFQAEEGKLFQRLIEYTIKADPSERMSLEEVLHILQPLQAHLLSEQPAELAQQNSLISDDLEALQEACRETLQKISEYKYDEHDILMENYIVTKLQEINSLINPESLTTLQETLSTTLHQQQSREIGLVKAAIQDLRDGKKWYSINRENKARKIEEAFRNTPIENRGIIISGNILMQETLAEHRHYPFNVGPAKTVENMKAALAELRTEQTAPNEPELNKNFKI